MLLVSLLLIGLIVIEQSSEGKLLNSKQAELIPVRITDGQI